MIDTLWVLISACLVFTMQAGFLCLESGLVRSKNSINVAAKNISDFILSSAVFWMLGFGLMFGDSLSGFVGSHLFFFGSDASANMISIFIFQVMFCATASTLVSGAVAERTSYLGYLIITLVISLFIYPITGHWAWGGIVNGEPTGWLEKIGFVDFAGSTVVHSVGGWVALAAIMIIGPRLGRFDTDGNRIPGSNLPLAVLGALLIWFGWFGFNGGSTLSLNDDVPIIILNTLIGAVWGGIATTAIKYFKDGYVDVLMVINGALGGLVSITANCHVVSATEAACIGMIAGGIVYLSDHFMEQRKLDDAIGVVPVHLVAGIWGTLAIALFADLEKLGTGLSRFEQLQSQLIGVVSIGLYSFTIAYILFKFINHFYALRINEQSELIGLNVSEHQVSTEMFDLLSAMQRQQHKADFSSQVPVEPFTEVGQIARQYNLVIDKVNDEIKQRDQAFSAFKQSEFRKGAILDAAMDCIVTIDERGSIIEFNPAAEQCFGMTKKSVKGINFFTLFIPDSFRAQALESLSQYFMLGEGLIIKKHNVIELLRSDGQEFVAEVVITQTSDEDQTNLEFTLHIRDVTQQIKLQNRLKELAYNDPLTGLFNRTYFMTGLKRQISSCQNQSGSVVLMFLDLDKFKQINDNLGHKAGDKLLCEVADRLKSVFREVDLVCRWGGDEFVVSMVTEQTQHTAKNKAQEILTVMHEPVYLEHNLMSISSSIGIAISNQGKTPSDVLLQRADMAMYIAKEAGRNNYKFFEKEMELSSLQRFQLEHDLPQALTDRQLFLQYQPKVCCRTNRLLGFEALIRWQHPKHGFIPPNDFIPVIDESSLIIKVDEWVITTAIEQLVEWQQMGLKLCPIAVNISGHHLTSGQLVPFVENLLKKHKLPGELLEFEITEGVLTSHTDDNIKAMHALKKINIKLSIDDFGTGYSSLSYLKNFPVDVLKIDRMFIKECSQKKEDAAICKAIITLAKSLGLDIVAEGVETTEQLKFLKKYRCDLYQGYLFSRPIDANVAADLIGKSVS